MKSLVRFLQEWIGGEWPEPFLKRLADLHQTDTATVRLALGVLHAKMEGDYVIYNKESLTFVDREREHKDDFRLWWGAIESALGNAIYHIFDDAFSHGKQKATMALLEDPPNGWEVDGIEWVKNKKTSVTLDATVVTVRMKYNDWESFRELVNHFDIGD